MDNLNVIDYLLLAIFFFSILAGFGKGFVREVISLLTVIAAVFVGIAFSSHLAGSFTNMASVQNAVNQASSAIGANTAQPVSYVAIAISFGILFAGTVIIGALLGFFLNIAVQTGMLGIGNRILGAIFGLGRGFVLNVVLIFIFQLTPFGASTWWQQSQLVADFQPAVLWLATTVSPGLANMKEKVGQSIQNVDTSIQNMTH